MTCYETKHLALSAVVVAAFFFCSGAGTAAYFAGQEEPAPEVVEEPLYVPKPWKGRVECVYGNTMSYSVEGLVDFIVTAQAGGWMWEMFREDGTVIFYQQPSRTFCSAVPEE